MNMASGTTGSHEPAGTRLSGQKTRGSVRIWLKLAVAWAAAAQESRDEASTQAASLSNQPSELSSLKPVHILQYRLTPTSAGLRPSHEVKRAH
jgi:hypothetical protein